jgi:hypothetical protein
MAWIEIPQELYSEIYILFEDDLQPFGTITHLENCSAYDAKILTEWGFRDAGSPLIRSVCEPESQRDIPKDPMDWEHRYYIYKAVEDKDND